MMILETHGGLERRYEIEKVIEIPLAGRTG